MHSTRMVVLRTVEPPVGADHLRRLVALESHA